ncbi:MAG: hypothetical protein ABIJ20_04650 [Nanoarchaeota archaeon]|nr:hypothetical protein [Nanoarchaeota archaeon]MBU1445095.1 hypothetical protein [Nanoarchaeota archaeon]MBU2406550.1 hypothetical protein [Nanoarchaeota archaeon]MBU2420350.1 hypothetical protein [Nanoarchaeota archaeon]MBU2474958.1 hypothetical protein [Nanoarchaeota archaeon]
MSLLEKLRKPFIVGTMSLGILLGSFGCSKEQIKEPPSTMSLEQSITTSEFFKEFPNEIPGMASIERYNVEDAKHCLVHIRSVHYSDPENGEKWAHLQGVSEVIPWLTKHYSWINECQKNTYTLIDYLISNLDLQEIYVEGYTFDLNVENDLDIRTVKRYKEYIEKDLLKRGIKPEKGRDWSYVVGAPYILFTESKINLLQSENPEPYNANLNFEHRLLEQKGQIDGEEDYKEIKNKREDFLLDLISKRGVSYAVVWYGGGAFLVR